MPQDEPHEDLIPGRTRAGTAGASTATSVRKLRWCQLTLDDGRTEEKECDDGAATSSGRHRGLREESRIWHDHHGERGSVRDEGETQADHPPANNLEGCVLGQNSPHHRHPRFR